MSSSNSALNSLTVSITVNNKEQMQRCLVIINGWKKNVIKDDAITKKK